MDTNNFELTCSQITAISFNGSFMITPGEDYQLPPTFRQNGSTWTMTLQADRKNSPPVASSYNSVTGGPGHQYAETFIDQSPEALNFYFGTVVTFQVGGAAVPLTLYFGQGHSGFNNNWWIGGTTVFNNGGSQPVLVVSGANGSVTFNIQADVSSMTLTPA
jgi:hypothetical protein